MSEQEDPNVDFSQALKEIVRANRVILDALQNSKCDTAAGLIAMKGILKSFEVNFPEMSKQISELDHMLEELGYRKHLRRE
jgi:hypothetical protein